VVDIREEFTLAGADRTAGGCVNNFVKSVRFSPDGVAVLVNSDDNQLRIFDVPDDVAERQAKPLGTPPDACEGDLAPALCVPGGESVYDCCWWPAASALEPASFVFLAAARSRPLHLLDGISGRLRATYRCVCHLPPVLSFHGSLTVLLCSLSVCACQARMTRLTKSPPL
jgi:WD40 repeat protein